MRYPHGSLSGYNHDRCRCELCRAAKSANTKSYREQNRDRTREQKKRYWADNPGRRNGEYRQRRARTIDGLGGKCAVCGSVEALEFDHVDPETKSARLQGPGKSSLMNLCGTELAMELALCQILCRNCHRRKTRRERAIQHHE